MSLSGEAIVAAAVEILDSYGLADLTMRRLADQLGVRAGALYWHVPNKQTLLARVADAMVGSVAVPGAMAWREGVVVWATSARAALLAHRDSAELVAAARASGLVEVDLADAPTALLVRAGLPEADARRAALALVHQVLGSVSDEQARAEWARLGGSTGATSTPPRETGSDFAYALGLLVSGVADQLR